VTLFVDTSALYAVLDRDDADHPRANEVWREVVSRKERLVTSNYVLVETCALLQTRMGVDAVRLFEEDVVPILSIEWINEAVHRSGSTALLTASRRKLSLVDCVSFEVMRALGIKSAFTLDRHFKEQGFHCLL
jgi:predicted nucleic acid-binding protein